MSNHKNNLNAHEWVVILVFSSLIAAIALLTTLRSDPPVPPEGNDLHVIAVGAVEKRGAHFLPVGATVQDLCRVAKPSSDSVPVNVSLEDVLEKGQRVRFKSQLVTVHIKGAVREPKSLKLKLGTVVGEVFDDMEFLPDAAPEEVADRLIKRSGQVITIPKKK